MAKQLKTGLCREGFTLIEILITVGVILLLSSLGAFIILQLMDSRSLAATQNILQARISEVRAKAIAELKRTKANIADRLPPVRESSQA